MTRWSSVSAIMPVSLWMVPFSDTTFNTPPFSRLNTAW
jgi:hypothetical protein